MFSENKNTIQRQALSLPSGIKSQEEKKNRDEKNAPKNSNEIAIRVQNLSKCYQIYDKPHDRLKQSLYPRLQRLVRQPPKQYYREFWALKDVSLEVKKGETVGIIGRNGSGKSTLLQIICGTLAPTGGSVETKGRIAALLELGSGFNPEFTGRENVYMNAAVLGLTKAEVDDRFDDIVAFADIGQFIEQPVKTYSSGMYVRLAFAVVAHSEPDLLVIDEALSVGDFLFQQKCSRFIRDQLANTTKLLVTHDFAAVSSHADRALLLNRGRMLYEGAPATVIEKYQIIARSEDRSSKSEYGNTYAKLSPEMSPAVITEDLNIDLPSEKLSGRLSARIEQLAVSIDGDWSARTISDGKQVKARLFIISDNELYEPIIGYQVQDRFGTVIFGDNSLSTGWQIKCLGIGRHVIEISWTWPLVSANKYGLTFGIGSGIDPLNHVIECWAHNVCVIDSTASTAVHGIFNAPLGRIDIIDGSYDITP